MLKPLFMLVCLLALGWGTYVFVWGPRRLLVGPLGDRRELDWTEFGRILRGYATSLLDRYGHVGHANKPRIAAALGGPVVLLYVVATLDGIRLSPLVLLLGLIMGAFPYLYYGTPKQERAGVRMQVPALLSNLRAVLADPNVNLQDAMTFAITDQRGLLFDRLRAAMERVQLGVSFPVAMAEVARQNPDRELEAMLHALTSHEGDNDTLDTILASMDRRIRDDAQLALEDLIGKRQVWVLVIGVMGLLPALAMVLFLPPLAIFFGWQ